MRVGRLEAALIELLGDAATGRLIELHSGEVLYIPRHVSRRHHWPLWPSARAYAPHRCPRYTGPSCDWCDGRRRRNVRLGWSLGHWVNGDECDVDA